MATFATLFETIIERVAVCHGYERRSGNRCWRRCWCSAMPYAWEVGHPQVSWSRLDLTNDAR